MASLIGYGISFVSFVLSVMAIPYVRDFLSAYVRNSSILLILTYFVAYLISFIALPSIFTKMYEAYLRR